MMTRQLATLLVAGLPLVDALGVLVDQTEKKPVKSLLADIREANPRRQIAKRGARTLPSGLLSDLCAHGTGR